MSNDTRTSMRNVFEAGRQIVALNHAQRVVHGGRPTAGALIIKAGRPTAMCPGLPMEPQAAFEQAMAGVRDLISASGADSAVVTLSDGVDEEGRYRYVAHHHLHRVAWVAVVRGLPGQIGAVGYDGEHRDATETPYGIFLASIRLAIANPAPDASAEHAAHRAITMAAGQAARPLGIVDPFESPLHPSLRCNECGHQAHDPGQCKDRSDWSFGTIVNGEDVSGQDAGPCVCTGDRTHQL